MKVNPRTIETICAKKGILVGDFAKAAGISRGTIYNIIKGKKTLPPTVYKIAKSLNVDVEEIII